MKKFLLGFIVILSFAIPAMAQVQLPPVDSNDDPRGPMLLHETQVRKMLTKQGLDSVIVDEVIKSLKEAPGSQGGELALAGALTSSGWNGSFFVDNDNWNFDGNMFYRGNLLRVPKLFDVYYWDGGFKATLEYKWVWIFLPKGTNMKDLDGAVFGGAVFGRGLALGTGLHPSNPVYVEGGWVKNQDGLGGSAYILSVGAGLIGYGWSSGTKKIHVGGRDIKKWVSLPLMVTFPKLAFRQKVLLPDGY
jgi:hypothetical protein